MKVTAVAQPSPASTKNCHGWRTWSSFDRPSTGPGLAARTWLVEVAELIIDALLEGRIALDNRLACRVRRAAPFHCRKPDRGNAGAGEEIRKHPRNAVEPFVDRRAQELMTAVHGRKRFDDLVVVLAAIDLCTKLRAHFFGVAACASI